MVSREIKQQASNIFRKKFATEVIFFLLKKKITLKLSLTLKFYGTILREYLFKQKKFEDRTTL